MFIVGLGAVVCAATLSACGSASAAGGVASERPSATLAPGSSQDSEKASTAATSAPSGSHSDGSGSAGSAGSGGSSSDYSGNSYGKDADKVSPERAALVDKTVRDYMATIPNTQVVSIRAISEEVSSAGAQVRVVRDGKTKNLYVVVSRKLDAWKVSAVTVLGK